jgi:sporulation protein YlmC with PRC-barrel domain
MKRAELKRKLVSTLVMSAVGVLAGGTAFAADMSSQPATGAQQESAPSSQAAAKTTAEDIRASKLIGMKVVNTQNENLGKIDDLVVDVNNERVAYAVLAFGGAMGMGDKLFAYPVGVFQPTADRKELVLNLDKDKLKAAPGFERKNWPDWNKDTYRADVERYFGPTISPKALPNQRLARASDLIGKKVEDRTGQRIGKIEDIVVNPGSGKLHYAVLDLGKPWTINDTLVPMSLSSFTVPADQHKNLVANVSKDQIDVSQGFKERQWPDLNDPGYQSRVDAYLSGRSTGAAGPVRE